MHYCIALEYDGKVTMVTCRANFLVNLRVCALALALSSCVLSTLASTLPDARDDVPSTDKQTTAEAHPGDVTTLIPNISKQQSK